MKYLIIGIVMIALILPNISVSAQTSNLQLTIDQWQRNLRDLERVIRRQRSLERAINSYRNSLNNYDSSFSVYSGGSLENDIMDNLNEFWLGVTQ